MLTAHTLLGNAQRLDGGAMFGNAPRAVWSRWSPPDELGRIDLACRTLLLEDGDRRVLLETGIGTFFEPGLRERYGVVEETHVLLESLAARGLSHEQIDVVILSHLHFDHAGGLLAPYVAGRELELLFPKATFVVGKGAWERARKPHRRDRASFIPELPGLLEASGRLVIVEGARCPELGERYQFRTSDGHTPGMLHTLVRGEQRSLFYCADLIPGVPWVHLPITMGYDRYPERLIDEKERLYEELKVEADPWLVFTHDAKIAASRFHQDERGRWRAKDPTEDLGEGWDLDASQSGG